MNTTEWPPIGSWWKENEPRFETQAREVVAHNVPAGKVGLKGARNVTWAKVERFNGKQGGYMRTDETR